MFLHGPGETSEPIDAALDPKPVARLDVVRLAAEPEPDLSGLFGGKAARLPLDHLEQGISGRWFPVRHGANIQGSCINMQYGFFRFMSVPATLAA